MKKYFLILLSTFLFSSFAHAEKGNIEVKSEVFKLVEFVDKKGKKSFKQVPVGDGGVLPKETVIYLNTVKNIGKEAAENIVVTNPIAEQLTYVDGSAKGKATEITFSVDGGKTYHDKDDLVVTNKKGKKRPAVAKDYQAIKWVYLPKLKPGEKSSMSFKAILGDGR